MNENIENTEITPENTYSETSYPEMSNFIYREPGFIDILEGVLPYVILLLMPFVVFFYIWVAKKIFGKK